MPSSSTGTTYVELELIKAFKTIHMHLSHCDIQQGLQMFTQEYANLLELTPSDLLAKISPLGGHSEASQPEHEASTIDQHAEHQQDATKPLKRHQRYWKASYALSTVSMLLESRLRREEAVRWNEIARELDQVGDKFYEIEQRFKRRAVQRSEQTVEQGDETDKSKSSSLDSDASSGSYSVDSSDWESTDKSA